MHDGICAECDGIFPVYDSIVDDGLCDECAHEMAHKLAIAVEALERIVERGPIDRSGASRTAGAALAAIRAPERVVPGLEQIQRVQRSLDDAAQATLTSANIRAPETKEKT